MCKLSCHPVVLQLAHTVPWAGHICTHQLTILLGNHVSRCPNTLHHMSYLSENKCHMPAGQSFQPPLCRIAMDILGPLEKNGAGHQYILVVCECATWYPEVFPPHTIHALVQFFSRVGKEQRNKFHITSNEAVLSPDRYYCVESQSISPPV